MARVQGRVDYLGEVIDSEGALSRALWGPARKRAARVLALCNTTSVEWRRVDGWMNACVCEILWDDS